MARSKIEWTESTWNPVTGCTKISMVVKTAMQKEWPDGSRLWVLLPGATPRTNLRFGTSNIDWVIVGGESGPKSRPIEKEWVLQIKNTWITQKKP